MVIKKTIPSVFIIILFCFIISCFNPFAPKLDKNLNLEQLITEQKTPDEVLINFKYAYTFKDSALYADLLDDSFRFLYFDPNYGTSGQFVPWGRDMDLLTTGRLFRNYDVIDLVWNSTIYSLEEENFAELSKSFHLNLINDEESVHISGNAIFTFSKNQDDQKWRIVRWKDDSDL